MLNGEVLGIGWLLKWFVGVGSGFLLYNGKVKSVGGNDKKVIFVVVEVVNVGIKGKGVGMGLRKNIKSMFGEFFMLKLSKKFGGVDLVVFVRKLVSDIFLCNVFVFLKDFIVKR